MYMVNVNVADSNNNNNNDDDMLRDVKNNTYGASHICTLTTLYYLPVTNMHNNGRIPDVHLH